ncbi:MAG: hypothetical protein N2Z72_02995 [Bacteroidales bacterium]|nr:hypothetical protein [Bacteroidales bacterium]
MDSGLYIYDDFYKDTNNHENLFTCPAGCPSCLINKFKYDELWKSKLFRWQEIMKIPVNWAELHPALPHEKLYYRKKALLHVNYRNGIYELGFKGKDDFFSINYCLLHDKKINFHLFNLQNAFKSIICLPIKYVLIHKNQIVLVIKETRNEQILKYLGQNFLSHLPREEIQGFHVHFNPSTGNRIFQKNVLNTLHGSIYCQDEDGFFYSPLTFTQHQKRMVNVIINISIDYFQNHTQILDLYGGIGITTHFFKKYQFQTTLVENHPDSVICAKLNNPDAEILQGKTYDRLNQLWKNSRKFDAIFLNPPRAGIDNKTIELIFQLQPHKIAYLSCNPHSLQKDLIAFYQQKYRLDYIHIFDFFPFTFHIETFLLLQKVS